MIELVGTVVQIFDSEKCKSGYFRELLLEVPRLSNTVDTLIIRYKEKYKFHVGDHLALVGSIRSYRGSGEYKTRIKVYSDKFTLLTPEEYKESLSSTNKATYTVVVQRASRCRQTPNGYKIVDLELAYQDKSGKYYGFPAIAWGSNAVLLDEAPRGLELSVEGRLQSRSYNKEVSGVKKSRVVYELSISQCRVL
jgi:single-strand DNA-binding protein